MATRLTDTSGHSSACSPNGSPARGYSSAARWSCFTAWRMVSFLCGRPTTPTPSSTSGRSARNNRPRGGPDRDGAGTRRHQHRGHRSPVRRPGPGGRPSCSGSSRRAGHAHHHPASPNRAGTHRHAIAPQPPALPGGGRRSGPLDSKARPDRRHVGKAAALTLPGSRRHAEDLAFLRGLVADPREIDAGLTNSDRRWLIGAEPRLDDERVWTYAADADRARATLMFLLRDPSPRPSS